jgi:glucokinase
MSSVYLLTGDIGGTNSRMALYDAVTSAQDNSHDQPLVEKYYRNTEHIPAESYNDPEIFQKKIVMPFIQYCWEEYPSTKDVLPSLSQVQIIATFAVAGFVLDNKVNLTNLGSMLVDGSAISASKHDKYLKQIVVCRIINDFVAVSSPIVKVPST